MNPALKQKLKRELRITPIEKISRTYNPDNDWFGIRMAAELSLDPDKCVVHSLIEIDYDVPHNWVYHLALAILDRAFKDANDGQIDAIEFLSDTEHLKILELALSCHPDNILFKPNGSPKEDHENVK